MITVETMDQNDDTPRTDDDQEHGEHAGNGVVIGVVVGVVVLLSAVLGVSLLTGGGDDSSADVTVPTSVEPARSEPEPPRPDVRISAPERIDAELTAWNEAQGPAIAYLLSVLGAPPVRDITLLRFRCKQLLEPLADLEAAPAPGVPAVAEAFDLWLVSVRDAVDFCLEGSQELNETDAVAIAGSGIGSTGMFWEIFFNELAKHVDLTGQPGAPLPSIP